MRNKSILLAVVSLVLLGVVTVGATLAYLTDTQSAETTYTLGNVKITLEEPIWEAGNSEQSGYFDGDKALLSPGRIIKKDPTIKIDAESSDCYIRLKVTIDYDLWNVIDLPKPNTGWTAQEVKQPAGMARVYYYTYENKLTQADFKKAYCAFSEVEVLPVGRVASKTHEELLAMAVGKDIVVVAQAIQSDGFVTAKQAFDAFDAFSSFADKA